MNTEEFIKRMREIAVEWVAYNKQSKNTSFAYGFNSGLEKAARELEEELETFEQATKNVEVS